MVIDENTKNRCFGNCARILVDIDLSKKTFQGGKDSVMPSMWKLFMKNNP